MKAFIFVLIQFLGIHKCNSQGTELKPPDILIEPVDHLLPPGMNPPPPPPPVDRFSASTVGNQGSNIQISYPKLIPTPSGASYPRPGESPIVNVNSGGHVIKEWLPTNVQDMLNLPKDTGLNINSFRSNQQPEEYPVPAKQVIDVFGTQAKDQSGATLMNDGSFLLPRTKSSNPSVSKNTAGVFVDGSLGAGTQNNVASDPMDSYFYNEARNDNRLPETGFKLNNAATIQNVKNFIDTEKKILNSAFGMVNEGLPSQSTGIDLPTPQADKQNDCDLYKPYRPNNEYYLEKVYGEYEIRPCPPGTIYNITVCSCSDRRPVSTYKHTGCQPQMHADFTTGFIDLTNKTDIANENAQLIDKSAYLNGKDAMLVLWKFSAFDYRQKLTIQFRFKPDQNPLHLHPRSAQPLITNCQIEQFLAGTDERRPPSIIIMLNTGGALVTFVIITNEMGPKPEGLVLPIRTNDWNRATLVYDGSFMYAEVNGRREHRKLKGQIENPNAPLTIGHCDRYGWFQGLIDDVKIYGQCDPNLLNL